MKFSGKSFPINQNLLLWPGNDFTLSFSLQIISRKRERKREREKRQPKSERERKKRLRQQPQTELQSDDRTAPIVNCSTALIVDHSTAPLVDCAARRSQHCAARSHLRSRCSISPPISSLDLASNLASAWSHLHCAISFSPLPCNLNLTGFDEFFRWILFLLWMSVELIHYPHVYSWGSVWKIGYVKHFL